MNCECKCGCKSEVDQEFTDSKMCRHCIVRAVSEFGIGAHRWVRPVHREDGPVLPLDFLVIKNLIEERAELIYLVKVHSSEEALRSLHPLTRLRYGFDEHLEKLEKYGTGKTMENNWPKCSHDGLVNLVYRGEHGRSLWACTACGRQFYQGSLEWIAKRLDPASRQPVARIFAESQLKHRLKYSFGYLALAVGLGLYGYGLAFVFLALACISYLRWWSMQKLRVMETPEKEKGEWLKSYENL